MKPSRRLGRGAGEQRHGEVERAPPRVDRRGPAPVGRAERRQRERRLGGRGEVVADLGRVVPGVLVVLVERHVPRDLLRHRVDRAPRRPAGPPPPARPWSRRRPAGPGSAAPARRARRCAPPPPRASAGPAPPPASRSRQARAASRSPGRARSAAARRAAAPARAGRAPPPACRAAGCGRAACHRSQPTDRRKRLASPEVMSCSLARLPSA